MDSSTILESRWRRQGNAVGALSQNAYIGHLADPNGLRLEGGGFAT